MRNASSYDEIREAIKLLGTNGGSYYGAGGAHPFENPTGFTNLFDLLFVIVLPFAIIFFGLGNLPALFLVIYGVFLQVYLQVVTGVKLVSRDWKRAAAMCFLRMRTCLHPLKKRQS